LLEKPEEKRPLGRYTRRWADNIKRDLKKWDGGMDWSVSRQEHVAGSCECGDKLSGSIKCGEFIWLSEDRLASQEVFCSMESVYIAHNNVIPTQQRKQSVSSLHTNLLMLLSKSSLFVLWVIRNT
jgi:hypothetical protein